MTNNIEANDSSGKWESNTLLSYETKVVCSFSIVLRLGLFWLKYIILTFEKLSCILSILSGFNVFKSNIIDYKLTQIRTFVLLGIVKVL